MARLLAPVNQACALTSTQRLPPAATTSTSTDLLVRGAAGVSAGGPERAPGGTSLNLWLTPTTPGRLSA